MKFLPTIVAMMMALCANAQERSEVVLNSWSFSRDGSEWQQVAVPHDWAISGPFDKRWDLQRVAIVQNGETEATEKSGRSGALPWIGEGCYRTTVDIDALPGFAELVFDGAMSEPTVYVNGRRAGYWAYGYNAFRVDCTEFLHSGSNAIEVRLKNVEESSRWYPGGGLYRPVRLLTAGKTHIDDWSLYIRTMSVNDGVAHVEAEGRVAGAQPDMTATMTLEGPDGSRTESDRLSIGADGKFYATFKVKDAQLWSPESPSLYRVVTKVIRNADGPRGGELVDSKTLKTGLRTVSVSREGGFRLNGISRKLKGVCLHHDLGPLGAAVNKAALIRQIRLMKEMGADAIRTSHNMPSTMQMEVCDSMGMMVMAESFDMWIYPKCKNGYARFFREWAERDITNLVLNHRNHPSIVMWSIGNEIPEQWSEEGRQISVKLQGLCHVLDPSRPVTQGMDRPDDAVRSGFAKVMDVPGFNYRVHKYDPNFPLLPQGFLLGSETASTISSRGVYKFPVVVSDHAVYPDGQCSSYDTEYCSWSNLPDEDFRMMDDRSWTIGQFVWTGIDYLGEPTPYDEYWPSRSSYFGICDLAGLPKDRYYLYRSQWNTREHTIHLLPHWTWPGREGEVTPVYSYTDYPEAELFVNGKSQGRIRKSIGENRNELSLDRYRLRWNEVRYEPGELKVVVYDADGRQAGEQTLCTAGKAARIRLQADRTSLQADGNDLVYVTVSLVDKKGNEVPTAADLMQFDVSGEGAFKCVCNGDATSLESFVEPQMHLFNGKLVVTVQAGQHEGTLTLRVTDKTNRRVKPAVMTMDVKR